MSEDQLKTGKKSELPRVLPLYVGDMNIPRQDLRSGALFARFSKVLYASSEILEEAKGGVRAISESTPRPLNRKALAAWAPGSVHAACLRGGSASSASASPATSTGAPPRDRHHR